MEQNVMLLEVSFQNIALPSINRIMKVYFT